MFSIIYLALSFFGLKELGCRYTSFKWNPVNTHAFNYALPTPMDAHALPNALPNALHTSNLLRKTSLSGTSHIAPSNFRLAFSLSLYVFRYNYLCVSLALILTLSLPFHSLPISPSPSLPRPSNRPSLRPSLSLHLSLALSLWLSVVFFLTFTQSLTLSLSCSHKLQVLQSFVYSQSHLRPFCPSIYLPKYVSVPPVNHSNSDRIDQFASHSDNLTTRFEFAHSLHASLIQAIVEGNTSPELTDLEGILRPLLSLMSALYTRMYVRLGYVRMFIRMAIMHMYACT